MELGITEVESEREAALARGRGWSSCSRAQRRLRY